MSQILEKLGIYGCSQENENAILASMLTGDPLLFIGEPGTAKTSMSLSIGAAMREHDKREKPDDPEGWFKSQAYDCSKINFEDLIGFPSPQALLEDRVAFVQSPLTVWGKDLVVLDEFNRQTPERQNNLFELVRSRSIAGMDTGTKWVFACMNPYGMAGTEILDDALVDRMAFFLYVKPFSDMDELTRDSIINHKGTHDAPALRYWTGETFDFDVDEKSEGYNEDLANAGAEILEVLESAAKRYQELDAEVGEAYAIFIDKYFNTFCDEMSDKAWITVLSGRRAGLVKRALVSYRAIELTLAKKYEDYALPSLKTTFKAVLSRTLPVGIATSASVANVDILNTVSSNVDRYSQFFHASDPITAITATDIIYELITTNDVSRKIEILIHEITDPLIQNRGWSDFIDELNLTVTRELIDQRTALLLVVVAHLASTNANIVPENILPNLVQTANRHNDLINSIVENFQVDGGLTPFADEVTSQINSMKDEFAKVQSIILWRKENKEIGPHRVGKLDFERRKVAIATKCAHLTDIIFVITGKKEKENDNSLENVSTGI